MAKTRSKPATAKKTEAPGSATSKSAAVIRLIPLNQLEPSPLNVRKVAASASDDVELLASIRETGIKQNLVVHALSETRFAVDAGGRRLKALKQLAEDGVIPGDHPVPCLVEDERNAILTSATENLQRTAMHPADQFEAFDKMIGEGRGEEEIALKFGVSVDLVRRRLKLARVAPEIIGQFRAGDLTLECVMAFTLTDDHDRQLAVWNAVKGTYHIHPQSIKRQLTETAHSANSALGRFVGIEAYEAAGGILLRDLFDDRASAHMENPDLLERLAIEKLQAVAKSFEAEWKWVEVHLSVDYGAFRSFGRVYPQDVDPHPDLLAEEERLIAREEELAAQNDGEDWTDAETEEYYAIEPRLREIEALQRERQPYADEDRAIAGVVLTIGHDGALRVEKGLVRPEDIPAATEPGEDRADAGDDPSPARPHVTPPTSSSPVPTSDPAATLRKADGISASLADDLRATRQHILRAHLAADFEVAFDVMLYALCEQALGRSYNNEALDISIRPFQAQNREVLHADTVAQKMLEALEQDLATDWMKLDKPEDFRAMSALPIADKQALFAWAGGLAVKPQLNTDNRPSPIIEAIGARLDVDVAACWRPTAQNYWGRVNKGHAVATARNLIGDDYAEDRNRERKGDLAAAMERAFAETAGETEGFGAATVAKTTRWLPDGMVFAGTSDADFDPQSDEGKTDPGGAEPGEDAMSDMDDEPEVLPAFLRGDAA
ncbi:MAG: plasmid partitioning protein ParB [Roseovarius sp. BRH_c41]|uniref:ParB/RepB/Spo0J family partition protein n=1 Tax=Roseovarius sp. BRH_c41 TaxID=1629709 RepID=UPI0005F0E937|nr:ParB/RepB/Spo0J family partition protein [Roseovarius sp. BRH_c41]KJS43141.1 MAG: plasmid partitioning protein ParB [Roseovarius sp. BRH_c41]